MAKTKTTATKKSTKAATPDVSPPAVKFVKGAFYEDAKKNLWYCTSPKPKKTPDGHAVVLMQKTEDGVQVGEPGEEYADTFVRQLTKADVKEYRDACRREKEALAETEAVGATTDTPADGKPAEAKKTRVKKEKPAREKKVSCLDAAALVLADAKEPLSGTEMIEAMATRGLWTSPGGATPHATLYAAIIREVAKKGAEARFIKTDRGRFTANANPAAMNEASAATAPEDAAPADAKVEGPEKPATKKGTKGGGKPADGTPGPKAVAELFKLGK